MGDTGVVLPVVEPPVLPLVVPVVLPLVVPVVLPLVVPVVLPLVVPVVLPLVVPVVLPLVVPDVVFAVRLPDLCDEPLVFVDAAVLPDVVVAPREDVVVFRPPLVECDECELSTCDACVVVARVCVCVAS